MRGALWPGGLIGRVGLVLFAAILLEVFGSTFVFERAEVVSSDDARAQRIAAQLDAAARILSVSETARRGAVAAILSEPDLELAWRETAAPAAIDTPHGSLRDKMVASEPSLARRHLALRAVAGEAAATIAGTLALDDGSALHFRARAPDAAVPGLAGQIGSILILSGGVLLAALMLVRTLAAPLRLLVRATDAIGHGPPVRLDATAGPREIRRVATAFNAMQDRIGKLVQDRTEALAAVSHDLRTPIGRMKLRAGFLASGEDQRAFEADLAEMEAMLVDLNAFLGGESDPEKPRPTDLAAILQTLADAATDAGHAAGYDGPDRLVLPVRALATKRAFSNIVNNAIAYGGGVRITLAVSGQGIVATFDDDGPGIAEADIAHVFEPFYRGDAARNRTTGGMGLGLAITRQAILREDGTIALANRPEGGLRVEVTLPR